MSASHLTEEGSVARNNLQTSVSGICLLAGLADRTQENVDSDVPHCDGSCPRNWGCGWASGTPPEAFLPLSPTRGPQHTLCL